MDCNIKFWQANRIVFGLKYNFEFSVESPLSPFDGPLTRQTAAFNRLTTITEASKARSFSPALRHDLASRSNAKSAVVTWYTTWWQNGWLSTLESADSAHHMDEGPFFVPVCLRSDLREADPNFQVTKNDINDVVIRFVEIQWSLSKA